MKYTVISSAVRALFSTIAFDKYHQYLKAVFVLVACHHIELYQVSDCTCEVVVLAHIYTQSTYNLLQPVLLNVHITQCQTQSFNVQSDISNAELQFRLDSIAVQLFHCIAIFLLSVDGHNENIIEVLARLTDVFTHIIIVSSVKVHSQGICIL